MRGRCHGPTCSITTIDAFPRLPLALAAWSRIGRHFGIQSRLRVSRRLCHALLADHTAYRGAGNFAFEIDVDDKFQATMLLGFYDPVVEAILRQYVPAGGIAIDAGAHLGYFSLRLARLVGAGGAVHAFECDPRLVPRLKRHVELNSLSWVTVNPCGLLDRESGEVQLYLPRQLGWSSVLEGAWNATECVPVQMVTLDGYATEHQIDPQQVSFIKLDVEGAELAAVRGASDVLAATSAPVLIEYLPERLNAMRDDPEELLALMTNHGFEPWVPRCFRRGRVQLTRGTVPSIGEDILFLKPSSPRRDGPARRDL